MSTRQREMFTLLDRLTREHGYPPTLRELGAHMGIGSTNGVNDHLRALERKGMVERAEMKSRGIRISQGGRAWLERHMPQPKCVRPMVESISDLINRLEVIRADIPRPATTDEQEFAGMTLERFITACRLQAEAADPGRPPVALANLRKCTFGGEL